jgi:hypothetical protein
VTLPAARAEGTVTAAPNGVAFPADYVHWSPISATSRFDNGTVRLIVGNAVAMRAIADRRIHPWPDGASLVKVAWHVGADATPPRFVQLELMTKDARAHASTEGWGFARWRGDALVPYGKDASFERECTGCHEPVRDHDCRSAAVTDPTRGMQPPRGLRTCRSTRGSLARSGRPSTLREGPSRSPSATRLLGNTCELVVRRPTQRVRFSHE